MKEKNKEYVKSEAYKEYIRLRISYYLENMLPEQKLRDYEAIRLHDNIMELLSMIDYAGDKLNKCTEELLGQMQKCNEKLVKRLVKEGKYKIL